MGVLSPHRLTANSNMKVFLALFYIFNAVFACIPFPGGPATTAAPSEPCKNLAQPCGDCCEGLLCAPLLNVCVPNIGITPPPCKKLAETCGLLEGACCDNLDCAPIINRCIPALGRKKRSADTDCKEVAEMEKAAFVVCEFQFAESGVPLPTHADFTMFDLNSDGTLFIE